MTVGLFIFEHDLRLQDQQALAALAARVDRLLCVYCRDPAASRPSRYGLVPLGPHRQRFLDESLVALDRGLASLGQRLCITDGEPGAALSQLIAQHRVQLVGQSRHSGVYERQRWQTLQAQWPDLNFIETDNHTLFSQAQLPFALDELPASFTPFRKRVEDLDIEPALPPLSTLPPPPDTLGDQPRPQPPAPSEALFHGGEHRGLAQLTQYFASEAPRRYKTVRNALQGWDTSTKFSPWLANGNLSPRTVLSRLRHYESRYGANESTYWIYFELLWREYFHWYAMRHGARLFAFSGIKRRAPLTSFYPQRFQAWTQGHTPFPLVNAAMNELRETGYLSNRGRQIVASCLVHELAVDWRYGAAWFEHYLIDYDVASNWGNWQYLAGVGADPRGHRHFDLDKQAQQFDADGSYTDRWRGGATGPLDHVDAADWPLATPSVPR